MKLARSDFTNLEQIGSGGASTVYRATALVPLPAYITRIHRSPSSTTAIPNLDDDPCTEEVNVVAIKVLNSDGSGMEHVDAGREVDLMKMVTHQNVLKSLGYFQDDESTYIVTEYCSRGTLTTLMRADFNGALTEHIAPLYTSFILRGLKALHALDIVHRDIKCSNLLLGKRAGMVIADFGTALQMGSDRFRGEERDIVGTAYFMAPEVIRGEGCTTASDIWSLGCTVIEMLQGTPYGFRDHTPQKYMGKLSRGEIQPAPLRGYSEELRDFLYNCLQRDVAKRSTAEALLRHPWINFKSLDGNDLVSFEPLQKSKHLDHLKIDSGFEESESLLPLPSLRPRVPLARSVSLKHALPTRSPLPRPKPSRSVDLVRNRPSPPPPPPPKDPAPSSPPPTPSSPLDYFSSQYFGAVASLANPDLPQPKIPPRPEGSQRGFAFAGLEVPGVVVEPVKRKVVAVDDPKPRRIFGGVEVREGWSWWKGMLGGGVKLRGGSGG